MGIPYTHGPCTIEHLIPPIQAQRVRSTEQTVRAFATHLQEALGASYKCSTLSRGEMGVPTPAVSRKKTHPMTTYPPKVYGDPTQCSERERDVEHALHHHPFPHLPGTAWPVRPMSMRFSIISSSLPSAGGGEGEEIHCPVTQDEFNALSHPLRLNAVVTTMGCGAAARRMGS